MLTETLQFSDEALNALPAKPGVFILRGDNEAEPYLANPPT